LELILFQEIKLLK